MSAEVFLESASRRERKKFETEQKLIKAAIALVSEKGLFEVTVEQITERADVGKGTFFNYFPSKEHLLASIFDSKREQVAMAGDLMREATDVKAALHKMVQFAINEPKRTPQMVQSIFSSSLTNLAVREPFCALINEGRNTIRIALERGQELGQVRSDLKPIEMAKFLQQVLVGTQAIWAMSDPTSDLDERIEVAFEIFWRGIAAQPVEANALPRRSKK
jgi:TetR/AcrR family transcriptional regulator, cholesterol catabolism regulator